jgi:radical SAM protein with 4Fe4S-binding SPASM domain
LNPRLTAPPKVAISITEACQLSCRHCYGDCASSPRQAELSIEEWRAAIAKLAEDGVISLHIEGGEPLLKPGFLGLLAETSRFMFTMVRTHGTLIDAPMARALRDAGVGRVLVDVMGGTAATHEWFTGVPGSFDASLDAVRHLVAEGVATDMLVILTRQNAPEVQGILDLAASLGAERVGVLRLYPLGRSKRIWSEIALPLEAQMRTITSLRVPPGLALMQSWHPNDHNCCWQSAAVIADGEIVGCPYLREYVSHGNLRSTTLLEAWQNAPLWQTLRAGAVERSCADCSAAEGSHGGCRATAYAWHGRWTAPDPFDLTLNDGVDVSHLPDRLLRA